MDFALLECNQMLASKTRRSLSHFSLKANANAEAI